MRKFLSNPYLLFALFLILAAGATVLAGRNALYHVKLNDFWTVLFYAHNLTWTQKASLYNGYYPFGYAFLIGQFPFADVVRLAYMLNALLMGLFVASVSGLIAARKSPLAVLLAFALSMFQPLIFSYANTPGPDIGTAAFPAFAMYLLWKDVFAESKQPHGNFSAALIGAALGLGFLWRTHVVVLAIAILILIFTFRLISSRSANIVLVATFLAFASIQIFINLISGHGTFETAQSFNVYKFLYGVNWTRTPTPAEIAAFSIWREIFTRPLFVFNAALPELKLLLSYALPGIACFIIAPKGALKKFSLFSALAIIIYTFPLSLGDSPRAPLAILGLYLASWVALFMVIMEWVSRLASARWLYSAAVVSLLVIGAFVIYPWADEDWTFIAKNRATHLSFIEIEQTLRARGMKSPDEVFSNKYQLYTPGVPPYLPRQITNWTFDWVWGFSQKYPPLPNDTWASFRAACVQQGIKFIVLSPAATDQAKFFSTIYENKFDKDKMGLEFIAQQANMRIYQLVPISSAP